MTTDHALLNQAKQWLLNDPNPYTAAHINELITAVESSSSATAHDELSSLFSQRIGFGTAGLRGRMSPGPSCMNDLVVIQTAQGLASYIKRRSSTNAQDDLLKAVVGYDHRSESKYHLSSKQFGMYTKLVFEQAGIQCTLLDRYVATPLLAFSVTALNAQVGIMITASHNPKADNGYKVYWSNGCQIVPPLDGEIAEEIEKENNLTCWMDYGKKLNQLRTNGGSFDGECFGLSDPITTKHMEGAYFATIASSGLVSATTSFTSTGKLPKFAYTAMHGVGLPFAKRSFETFHLPPFHAVPSQCDADPNFPTVSFPNPEEKGALNEAISYAVKNGCDIVLANDPDADRLGVAEFCNGAWNVFTGDQIGVLLGVWLWETVGKNCNKVGNIGM
jgi:phosphomannomutase